MDIKYQPRAQSMTLRTPRDHTGFETKMKGD